AALERTPCRTPAHNPGQPQALRAGRRQAALQTGAAGGTEAGTGAAGASAGPAGRRAEGQGGQADDRPATDLYRVPGVSKVWHDQSLLRVQAGPIERS